MNGESPRPILIEPHRWEAGAWRMRVLLELVRRDFRQQYRGAFLGALWALINPLLLVALFTFIFRWVLGVGGPAYTAFLLAGVVPWSFFATSLASTSQALAANIVLLRSHRVPPALFPAAACAAATVNLLMGVSLLALYRVAGGLHPMALVVLPLLIALQVLFTLGLGLVLGALNAVVRDTHQALLFALRAWFYVTPVLYSLERVPAHLRALIWLNPITGLIEGYRSVLLAGRAPSLSDLAPAALLGVALVLVGRRLTLSIGPYLAEMG